MRKLLEAMTQWDMMDSAADGKFWRSEINRVFAEIDAKNITDHAEKVESSVLEIANGKRRPSQIPLESIMRLVEFAKQNG